MSAVAVASAKQFLISAGDANPNLGIYVYAERTDLRCCFCKEKDFYMFSSRDGSSTVHLVCDCGFGLHLFKGLIPFEDSLTRREKGLPISVLGNTPVSSQPNRTVRFLLQVRSSMPSQASMRVYEMFHTGCGCHVRRLEDAEGRMLFIIERYGNQPQPEETAKLWAALLFSGPANCFETVQFEVIE